MKILQQSLKFQTLNLKAGSEIGVSLRAISADLFFSAQTVETVFTYVAQ